MKSALSRFNRRRLRKREARRAKRFIEEKLAGASTEQLIGIESLLDLFAPHECPQGLIRIGSDHDGGYLVPDDLDNIVALYSPGVSFELEFDKQIARRGISCFLADGTIDAPDNLLENMHFEAMMIGAGPPDRFMSLESWVARTVPSAGDLMLQMDIEGAEFDVLLATPRSLLNRFRIIVLELHALDRYLFDDGKKQLEALMDHLLTSHVICHIHPNTVSPPVCVLGRKVPPLVELTLFRKDRFGDMHGSPAVYPHPLDAPNDPRLPLSDYPSFWKSS